MTHNANAELNPLCLVSGDSRPFPPCQRSTYPFFGIHTDPGHCIGVTWSPLIPACAPYPSNARQHIDLEGQVKAPCFPLSNTRHQTLFSQSQKGTQQKIGWQRRLCRVYFPTLDKEKRTSRHRGWWRCLCQVSKIWHSAKFFFCADYLPSALSGDTRQRCFFLFFLAISLSSAWTRALGNDFFPFFGNFFAECLEAQHLAKSVLFFLVISLSVFF